MVHINTGKEAIKSKYVFEESFTRRLHRSIHFHSYETGNGIKGEETGTLKKASSPDSTDVIIVQGSNSYTGDDGVVYSITYIADDVNGYVPQGAHLPTPPPVPEAIARALQYIAANPPKN